MVSAVTGTSTATTEACPRITGLLARNTLGAPPMRGTMRNGVVTSASWNQT